LVDKREQNNGRIRRYERPADKLDMLLDSFPDRMLAIMQKEKSALLFWELIIATSKMAMNFGCQRARRANASASSFAQRHGPWAATSRTLAN
jgi:hypothetical protein